MNNSLYIDPLLTKIYNLLYRLGVRSRTLGFFETSCAIFLVMKNPERLEQSSVRTLYREIADLYHIDADLIDSHIRHVIRLIWMKKAPFLRELLDNGTPTNHSPSPKQFIGVLCRYLNAESDYDNGDFSSDAQNTV